MLPKFGTAFAFILFLSLAACAPVEHREKIASLKMVMVKTVTRWADDIKHLPSLQTGYKLLMPIFTEWTLNPAERNVKIHKKYPQFDKNQRKDIAGIVDYYEKARLVIGNLFYADRRFEGDELLRQIFLLAADKEFILASDEGKAAQLEAFFNSFKATPPPEEHRFFNNKGPGLPMLKDPKYRPDLGDILFIRERSVFGLENTILDYKY